MIPQYCMLHTAALNETKCRLKVGPLFSPLLSLPCPLFPFLQATPPPQHQHISRQLWNVLREENLDGIIYAVLVTRSKLFLNTTFLLLNWGYYIYLGCNSYINISPYPSASVSTSQYITVYPNFSVSTSQYITVYPSVSVSTSQYTTVYPSVSVSIPQYILVSQWVHHSIS